MSRGAVQGFQAERLRQMLAARRLSQVQLAAMAEVSPPTLSKWCAGTQSPTYEALLRLARVVNASPDWFTRTPVAKTSLPLFRSNAAAHKAARQMLEARLEWAQEIALILAEYVDYPEVNVPSFVYKAPEEIADSTIEEAASTCRSAWGLGRHAIEDLTLAAESAGIIVVREETGAAKIEGLSAWSTLLERPLVLLSSDKGNAYRSRFDLAHEIGHLVLHRHISHQKAQAQHNELERQAHRFAGALLLPAETFAAQVCVPPALDDLLILKRRFGASVAAMIMRLAALEIIDERIKTQLFKQRSIRWGAKSEPLDDERLPEKPCLFRRTIELLIAEYVMPTHTIPKHIGLSATDLESLAGLPSGYFDGKVHHAFVEFARLKDKQSTDKSFGGTVVPFRPLASRS